MKHPAFVRWATISFAAAALASCWASESVLIHAGNADTPIEAGNFTWHDQTDNERSAAATIQLNEDRSYTISVEGDELRFYLMQFKEHWFVVQSNGLDEEMDDQNYMLINQVGDELHLSRAPCVEEMAHIEGLTYEDGYLETCIFETSEALREAAAWATSDAQIGNIEVGAIIEPR
ncbi:hypothetical protein [Sphingomicrobium sediminis]|uniref:Lipoprotein n=1 Tax=Sphingomicrobium sediminis TaxID=2950949 RepID=A0A9X2EGS3_9SPHN|nr:hypothetical protein [Sphingomicrobium sediminis]MCM8557733.1 hypothetical protein [Sphingomicrobium sediminis]